MPGTHAELLQAWENFYVIMGSSAAGLTGLMFVVITLIPERRARDAATQGSLDAFGSSTLVHFGAALLVSAILSAPWDFVGQAGVGVAICGLAGLAYGAVVLRRMRRQTHYQTVREDWLWYVLAPLAAYGTLLVGGLFSCRCPKPGLFAIGAATVGLVLLGIRNAWDSIIFIATGPQE
jgi:hypothetical protein